MTETKSTNIVLGTNRETGQKIVMRQAGRVQGCYLLGVNGTGKSTLIANLIVQDMEQGLGLCLLDPHGDLTRDLLARVPENRLADVILLDLMDSAYPFGLNLFECADSNNTEQIALTAGFVMHVFEKVWNVGTETPQLAQVLRNVTFTLIQNPGTTLNEIPLLLQDETVRGRLISNVTNNPVKLFWTMYNKMRPADQMERTSSTLNKVDAFLTQPIIANIVGQSKTTLDFRRIIDQGKILLVQLNPRLEDISALVGSVIIGQILSAALSRKNIPEAERKQFNLYADEYQRFATEDFATLLSEARKFGVATTIAHQTRSQLDYANKGSSLGAGTKIVFRVSGEDGKELAREFDHTPTVIQIGVEPIRAPVTDAVKHLLEKGHVNPNAMAFNRYLIALQEFSGVKIDKPRNQQAGGGYSNDAVAGAIGNITDEIATGLFNLRDAHKYKKERELQMELEIALNALNEYFYVVMQTGDSSLLPPNEVLVPIDKLLRSIKLRNVDFITPLQTVVQTLAVEPILVDTGQYRPKYQTRTYADMEGEIASSLTNLPNFQAKIKTVKGEANLDTLPLQAGKTDSEYAALREQVIAQTRAVYCRSVSDVAQEIADRQAALQKEEERIQGRREVIGDREDGEKQFRPSRRHKEPPQN